MILRSSLIGFNKYFTSSNQKGIVQTTKNLINPTKQDPIAFGYYFPSQWNTQKIYKLLDPSRKDILSIKIVQNKLGKSAGKILFTFKNVQIMNKYINRYNEDYIQTQDSVHKIVLKRFELKNQQKKRQKQQFNRKYGVNLTNLDFDIDHAQLQRLAQDFGQIQYIQLPVKDNGLNRGSAKIYFKTKKSCQEFKQFADDLKYKQRKLKCSIIKHDKQLQKMKQRKVIEAPKIVMKWNQQLYKRLVKKQSEEIGNNMVQSSENKVY